MAAAGLFCRSLLRPSIGRCFSSLVSGISFEPRVPATGAGNVKVTWRSAHYERMPINDDIPKVRGMSGTTAVLVIDENRMVQGMMSVDEALLTQPSNYRLVLVKKNFHLERSPVVRRFSPEGWEGWMKHKQQWQEAAALKLRALKKARAIKERNMRKEKSLLKKGSRVYQKAKKANKK